MTPKHLRTRPKVFCQGLCLLLTLLSLAMGAAQGFTGKYLHVTADGQELLLLLQEQSFGTTGYLSPNAGIRFEFESNREQSHENLLVGQFQTDDETTFEATLTKEGLRLTLAGAESLDFERLTSTPISPESTFLKLLSAIPDSAENRQGFPFISYVNHWAFLEAYNLPQISIKDTASGADTCAANFDPFAPPPLSESSAALIPYYFRLIFIPDAFANTVALGQLISCMQVAVGISLFDIEAILQSNHGRIHNELVIASNVDVDQMQRKLALRDYMLVDLDGLPLFTRFDEGSINVRARQPSDPFSGELGRASRIAIFNTLVINASSQAHLRPLLEAQAEQRPSMAQAADIRSLVAALEAQGTIVQAGFFNTTDLAFMGQDPIAGLFMNANPTAEATENDKNLQEQSSAPLPFYGLSLLAEVDIAEKQQVLWALLFPDQASASLASEVIIERLNNSSALTQLESEPLNPSISQQEAGYVVTFGLAQNWAGQQDNNSALDYWWSAMINREFTLLSLE